MKEVEEGTARGYYLNHYRFNGCEPGTEAEVRVLRYEGEAALLEATEYIRKHSALAHSEAPEKFVLVGFAETRAVFGTFHSNNWNP